MKRNRHTPERFITKLTTDEQLLGPSKTVADVFRALEFSQLTYHRWWKIYDRMKAEEATPLTQLGKENARLKKLQTEAPSSRKVNGSPS